MWLCTQHGFFSAVRKGDEIHLRARVRYDLQELIALVWPATGKGRKILVWQDADYRYRIIITPAEFVDVAMKLAEHVDYSNFKSRIHESETQAPKLSAYGRLWSNLMDLQK